MVWKQPDGQVYVGKYPPATAKPLGILYPRAGTLGGCAAHNAMITIYPLNSDWTYIQSLTGDSSWAPDKMRGYYKKLERCGYLSTSVTGHGFTGWLGTSLTSLSLVAEDLKLVSLVLSAGTAMGSGLLGGLLNTVAGLAKVLITDINSDSPTRDTTEGVYQVPLTMDAITLKRTGPRDFILNVANAVNPDGSRKYNLDIALSTLVTKVRFDQTGSTPKAIGVDFLVGKSMYAADPRYTAASGTVGSINATKEVILSAGTFNTPQLLKLSGVGPRAELQQFGINVVKDLPGVGTNMQDRYETTVVGQAPTNFTITEDCTFGYKNPDPCLAQWQTFPTALLKGTYASNGIGIAILKRSSTAPTAEPDLLISGGPVTFKGYYPGYAHDAVGVDSKHWSWITLKAHARNQAGTVTLRSADPRQVPEINFNYLDTGSAGADKDIQAVYEGMLFSRKMFNDLVPLDGSFTESWPGTNVSSKTDLQQFIKDEAWGHHASCTCAIGADSDPMAVLDSNFKVRGVDGLRVVDASSFPKIPGFYIALPVYMISEKAADAIINGM
jgi:choline dehydrogenase